MTNSVLQLVGFILSSIGGVCVLVTTFVPEWRRNDPSDELLETVIRHQGIWIKCVSYPTGQWQCDDFDAFFIGLPTELQVARGLCCSAVALGAIAFVLSLLGMECSSCFNGAPRSKGIVAMIGGTCSMLSGLLIGAAVSFYSYKVLQDYNRDTILFINEIAQRQVYGSCLFVGWAALVICFIGGLLLICGSRHSDDDDMREPYRPVYRAPVNSSKPKYNTEYV